jgi:hypothetical protein
MQDMKGNEGAGRCSQKSAQSDFLVKVLVKSMCAGSDFSSKRERERERESILGHKVELSKYSRALTSLTFADLCIQSSRERAAA